MQPRPLRTTVIGSYPFPAWLEFAAQNLAQFGRDDLAELQNDAVICAVSDQLAAGLDVITDGEQTRFDFNLSFYGFLEGIELESASPRRWGPPLSGRLLPNDQYRDRYALTDALLPLVKRELVALVEAGCTEITVDEPSMSCYAHKEDPARFVEIFNRTVEPIVGKCRLSTHLCFGNFKGRAVGLRRYRPMFPAFLDLRVDEVHLEMASREFSELEILEQITPRMDVAVGIIDVKSYYVEPPADVAERVRLCLRHAPAERLAFAPDCGLSQTARWAAREKLRNMVAGVQIVRAELGV